MPGNEGAAKANYGRDSVALVADAGRPAAKQQTGCRGEVNFAGGTQPKTHHWRRT